MSEQTSSNAVVLEGAVVGQWNLNGDTCLRLAVPRRPGMPGNPDGKNFDAVSVRFNYFLARQADLPKKGDYIRVQGLIQQRDTEETLKRALERITNPDEGAVKKALEALEGVADHIRLQRRETEVVVLSWEIAEKPERRERKRGGQRQEDRRSMQRSERPLPIQVDKNELPAANEAETLTE